MPVGKNHAMDRYADQAPHRVRFEWGASGAAAVAPHVVVCAVVDVLSFTTCVSVAVDAGIAIHPHRWGREGAAERAAAVGGVVAVGREEGEGMPRAVSLSPASLRAAATWAHDIVLPSPNGATLSAVAAEAGATVVAASLRTARVVAEHLAAVLAADPTGSAAVAVIACGERWPEDTLRPALEDLVGAGAVLDALAALVGDGALSPDARAAAAAYRGVSADLATTLGDTASGRELRDRGYPDDIAIAAEVDASLLVPVLREGRFVAMVGGVELRRATADDDAQMAEVWLRSFAGALPTVTRAHPDDDVRRWVRDVLVAGGRTWVAVDGGRVVGLLALRPGWVEQLYVDPAAQGRGIGAALLDQAKARNPGGLQLWTFQINAGARRFYAREGFVEVEHTDGAANEEREPDVRLTWSP